MAYAYEQVPATKGAVGSRYAAGVLESPDISLPMGETLSHELGHTKSFASVI